LVTQKEFDSLKLVVKDLQENVLTEDIVIKLLNVIHHSLNLRETKARKELLPKLIQELGYDVVKDRGVVKLVHVGQGIFKIAEAEAEPPKEVASEDLEDEELPGLEEE